MKKSIFLLFITSFVFIFFACEDDDNTLPGSKSDLLIGRWHAEYTPISPESEIVGAVDDPEEMKKYWVVETYQFGIHGGTHQTDTYFNNTYTGRKIINFDDWSYDEKNGKLYVALKIPGSGAAGVTKTQNYTWKRNINNLSEKTFYVPAFEGYFTKK